MVYTKAKNQKGLIDLSESIKVQMHPVAVEDMTDAMKKAKNNIEFAYWQAANCLDAVISGEDYQNEFTKQEAYDWIMSMPSTMSAKLIEYINDVPTAKLVHVIKCPKCGNTQEIVLTGLSDFFPNGLLAIL